MLPLTTMYRQAMPDSATLQSGPKIWTLDHQLLLETGTAWMPLALGPRLTPSTVSWRSSFFPTAHWNVSRPLQQTNHGCPPKSNISSSRDNVPSAMDRPSFGSTTETPSREPFCKPRSRLWNRSSAMLTRTLTPGMKEQNKLMVFAQRTIGYTFLVARTLMGNR